MLAPAVAWAFPALRKGIVAVPCLGAMNWHEVVAACTSMVVTLVWVLCRHEEWAWLLQDILGVSVCILFLRTVQLPNLKVSPPLLPQFKEMLHEFLPVCKRQHTIDELQLLMKRFVENWMASLCCMMHHSRCCCLCRWQ